VWVYDGKGKVLLTRRAPEKSAPGTWENSGGAAKAGEDSLTAIVRELQEETGIIAAPEEFELLDACTERGTHYDHYCLHRDSSKVKVVLQPGETDGVQWATFEAVHEMIRTREICKVIGKQFLRHEPMLLERQIKD
jgi:8-oxo-dGTP pyrophosphatase MutT (NUDIX family)